METDPNATALSDIFISHKINMVKQRWGCIYKLTNTLNGKYYIGKSVQFKRRMIAHKNSKHLKTYLSHAIRKYGWDAFKREIIIDNVPEEDLNQLEMSYIEIHDSTNPKKGYNVTKGGDGTSGWIPTNQTKKKMSMSSKKHLAEKGSIHFHKKAKKWEVRSAGGKGKYIGSFPTKELAEEALTKYIATGKMYLRTRTKGTGSITLTKSNTYKVIYKTKYIGCYKTKELAEEALKQYIKQIVI
tara:strand:- start:191 stop:916 length:726 start_codon:yes stop_codon:yes gene_type:complete